ncbi:MAG: GNAT family N-acetyltransferase [Balneolaceae bacterium]|nr:GNAT family N-acetyltransferase [Balneolaceae bacterium]
MKWKHISDFSALSPFEVYKLLKLRQDVFIIEQECIYEDIDTIDFDSEHVMLFDVEKLVAYSRLVPPGIKFDEYSIGRIIVDATYRGKMLGRDLVKKSIEILEEKGVKSIRIEAQEYLLNFYTSLGFEKVSDSYHIDGIPHVQMVIKTV